MVFVFKHFVQMPVVRTNLVKVTRLKHPFLPTRYVCHLDHTCNQVVGFPVVLVPKLRGLSINRAQTIFRDGSS